MAIKHQIVDKTDAVMPPGMDMLNQLSGLIGMATSMLGAGVSLPGIQGIGSQIAGMGPSIAAGGGAAGSSTDTSNIAGVMSSLGGLLSSATSMSGAGGILSMMTGQLGQLTNMINPAGGDQAQTIHSHILDAMKGITHSAFQGKHTVTLENGGINFQSIAKIVSTAPQIPHNGLTSVSDALQVSKGITGQSFGMLSDRRLKTKIKKHKPVLETLLKLRVQTFLVKMFDFEHNKIAKGKPRASRGLIAQELQKHFPELVNTDGKFLSIDIDGLMMMILSGLIEHVSETRKDIAEIRSEIARIKK